MNNSLARLLPAPLRVTETNGRATLVPGMTVTVAVERLLPIAQLLVDRVRADAGLDLAEPSIGDAGSNVIHLAVDAQDPGLSQIPVARGVSADGADLGAERCVIRLGAEGISLIGAAPAGLHRAATMLSELCEHAGWSGEERVLPAAEIIDGPALAWRGLSFDIVRHPFGAASVVRVIDLLDRYRMNVLHLHLTDDQGWRVEVPGKPELTPEGTVFLTLAEYSQIVDYAAARFITVVPEIDMPGHSAAAIRAYPHLSPSGVAHPVASGIAEMVALLESGSFVPQYLDVNKEEVWTFVDDVISWVASRTPGGFIHIGGDEPFGMPQREHFAFIERARKVVRAHGKEPIGWQEAGRAPGEPGDMLQLWIDTLSTPSDDNHMLSMLPEQFVAMITETFAASAQDPQRLVDARARVILSRAGVAYLDAPYGEAHPDATIEAMRVRLGLPAYPPVTIESAGTVPIEGIDGASELDIVGFEAAIWCESIESFDDLTFLLLPRLPLLAQRAWAAGPALDWSELRVRLAAQAPRWQRDSYTYFPAPSVDWESADA